MELIREIDNIMINFQLRSTGVTECNREICRTRVYDLRYKKCEQKKDTEFLQDLKKKKQ